MVVTLDTVVVGADRYPHDITAVQFERILSERGSPATPFALDGYLAVAAQRVSCAFELGCFFKESQFATDPAAVVVRYSTLSPGNCRSTRTGVGTVISTNRGPFVAYPSWTEGWRDMAWRIVDPNYVYVQEQRTTIRTIIERFAPADDSNDPEGYAQTVVTLMNRWIGEEQAMAGDDPRFRWMPDVTEYGYPQGTRGRNGRTIDYGIVHITAGTNSSAWLRGNNGSSTHYLTDRQLRPLEQHVRDADAAWTAGNMEYNLRGINVEAERPANQPWTREAIETFAVTTFPLWQRNDIPLDYLGKNSGGKRGLIAHSDVPDPDGSGWGGAGNHTDPGPSFDWPFYVNELRRLAGDQAPETWIIPGNPFGAELGFVLGFRDCCARLAAAKYAPDLNAAILSVTGYPRESEWRGTDRCTYQRCERVTLKYEPGTVPPWDIVFMLPQSELPEAVE